MPTSQKTGSIALFKFIARAIEKDMIVSIPSLEGCRYDAVLDVGGRLFRVQIKSRNLKPGRPNDVLVDLSSRRGRDGRGRDGDRDVRMPYYTSDEIDALVIYIPIINRFVFLTPDYFHSRSSLTITLDRCLTRRRNKNTIMAHEHFW